MTMLLDDDKPWQLLVMLLARQGHALLTPPSCTLFRLDQYIRYMLCCYVQQSR